MREPGSEHMHLLVGKAESAGVLIAAEDAKSGSPFSAPRTPPSAPPSPKFPAPPAVPHSFADASTILPPRHHFQVSSAGARFPLPSSRSAPVLPQLAIPGNIRDITSSGSSTGSGLGSGGAWEGNGCGPVDSRGKGRERTCFFFAPSLVCGAVILVWSKRCEIQRA